MSGSDAKVGGSKADETEVEELLVAEMNADGEIPTAEISAGSGARGRLRVVDAVRGFSVVSMVLFHLCYDLYFLYGVPLAFFEVPMRDVWRASISWTFLVVAGLMCSLSRDNLRRAGKYGLVALIIWVATSVAKLDDPISFGIIFCMAGSTFVAWVLARLGAFGRADLPRAAALVLLFLICRHISWGWIGLGSWQLAVPRALFATPWLSWLGFPGPGFISSDYYPLLPYSLLYLAGAHLGSYLMAHGGFPAWMREHGCPPLEFVGRHALEVYVLHQPIIFAVLTLVM